MKQPQPEIEASYDLVAEQFVDEFFRELERKPFDRRLLEEFAKAVRDGGMVCDIGCGPGQVARYLQDCGVSMRGIDLSQEMVKHARLLNPDIAFEKGDMLALNLPAASLAGVVSFYAIIHLRREDIIRALRGMHRVLEPGGRLLISFHGGVGELHRDEWYQKPISIDVTLLGRDEMAKHLAAAGFEVERIVERVPYEFEYPTPRLYAFGRKPEARQ